VCAGGFGAPVLLVRASGRKLHAASSLGWRPKRAREPVVFVSNVLCFPGRGTLALVPLSNLTLFAPHTAQNRLFVLSCDDSESKKNTIIIVSSARPSHVALVRWMAGRQGVPVCVARGPNRPCDAPAPPRPLDADQDSHSGARPLHGARAGELPPQSAAGRGAAGGCPRRRRRGDESPRAAISGAKASALCPCRRTRRCRRRGSSRL
jgi:hypothetical protein